MTASTPAAREIRRLQNLLAVVLTGAAVVVAVAYWIVGMGCRP